QAHNLRKNETGEESTQHLEQIECEFLKRDLTQLRENPYRRVQVRGDKINGQKQQLPTYERLAFRYDPPFDYGSDKSIMEKC
ncbi:hypothetical protein GWI33_006807, partial [Rhynchophorus ferrugineus]